MLRSQRLLLALTLLLPVASPLPGSGAPAAERRVNAARGPDAFPSGDLSGSEWIEKMVSALRPGRTLSARIDAWTRDASHSERRFEIELLRMIEGGRLLAMVEMRDASTPEPAVLKLESGPDGQVVSWSWDLRFRRFVRMRGLRGTEPFAGTHFRLEDLGFTALTERRSSEVRRVMREGRERVQLTSGPYHYYSRVITQLDPETGLPTRVVIYDNTGARIRELSYGGVELHGGRPLPTDLHFIDEITGAESRLRLRDVEIDLPLRVEDFDLEEIERRMREAEDPVRLPGEVPDGA